MKKGPILKFEYASAGQGAFSVEKKGNKSPSDGEMLWKQDLKYLFVHYRDFWRQS